jgi:hypothetical protein
METPGGGAAPLRLHQLDADSVDALLEILAQDPRPQYQDDPERIYGLRYGDRNVRFKVEGDILTVVAVE